MICQSGVSAVSEAGCCGTRERYSQPGRLTALKILVADGEGLHAFGKTSPARQNPRETQPHFESKFLEIEAARYRSLRTWYATTPEIAPRMGVVLFRPIEPMPLFMQGRVLLEPEPEHIHLPAARSRRYHSRWRMILLFVMRSVRRLSIVLIGLASLENWLLREWLSVAHSDLLANRWQPCATRGNPTVLALR